MEFRDSDYLSSSRQTTGLREKCNQAGYTFVLVIQQKLFRRQLDYVCSPLADCRSCVNKLIAYEGGQSSALYFTTTVSHWLLPVRHPAG